MSMTGSGGAKSHDDFAADYDQQVRSYGWRGHEALFGLCYEYVHADQRLLDAGIGTGLGSELFARAGLQVYGFDSSLEMLNRCRAKNIAVELKHFDLTTIPWPYPDASFDHVMTCGVLHFVAELGPVFGEVARLLPNGGSFAFTAKAPPPGTQGVMRQMVDGIEVYSHSKTTVEAELSRRGFEMLKCLRLAVGSGEESEDAFFAFVARKANR